MNSSELIKLNEEFIKCDSIRRRKEILKKVEKAISIIFKKLCKYKHGFMDRINASDDICWIDEKNTRTLITKSDWEDYDGVEVTFDSNETDDANRWNLPGKCVIDKKWLDYSDDDWKHLENEFVCFEIEGLKEKIRDNDVLIESLRKENEKLSVEIENLSNGNTDR